MVVLGAVEPVLVIWLSQLSVLLLDDTRTFCYFDEVTIITKY